MSMPTGYKPSPLGYGSPRNSPFRRPESPVSPSPLRQTTPSVTPHKLGSGGGPNTPSRFAGSPTPIPMSGGGGSGSWTPRSQLQPAAEISSTGGLPSSMAQGSALSQLQPAQVRTLREGFQILDRDSDGMVNRDDVADMLNQLGLPCAASDVALFFPPTGPPTMPMGTFLSSLATALAAMSPSAELLSALSAFDEDDSGQVDLVELRDALLHTAPEPGERPLTETEVNRVMQGFTGRRAFTNKSKPGPGFGKRNDVFRYQDFVQSISGSGQSATEAEAADA